MGKSKKDLAVNKSSKSIIIAIGAFIVLFAIVLLVKGNFGGDKATQASGEDLIIPKSEITTKAKFFPYVAGKTKMEVLAVKASDGSIRTAFNTCQVCYDSGRGYYKLEGDTLVCQNCGNRFKASQIELEKGGCNPVPIVKENKVDDGTNIVISKQFLAQSKELFGNWRKE